MRSVTRRDFTTVSESFPDPYSCKPTVRWGLDIISFSKKSFLVLTIFKENIDNGSSVGSVKQTEISYMCITKAPH